MLRQASVGQIRRGEITRRDGAIAVVMCHYPRGLRTETRDAFHSELAPDRPLFTEWKECERENGHEAAFEATHYEHRFRLSAWALHLLDDLSRQPEAFLVCQCEVGERCHREMLMLLARSKLGAKIDRIHNAYPSWERRVESIPWPLPESALATPERKFPALSPDFR